MPSSPGEYLHVTRACVRACGGSKTAVPFVFGSFLISSLETVYFFVFVGYKKSGNLTKKSGNLTKSRSIYAFIGNLNPFWSKLNRFGGN